MAFWGVEVKSGRPITHSCENANGRLRISQATLSMGESTTTGKCFVQCNIGSKRPVLICILVPGKSESCPLDLEFEEAEDVVFSVIGRIGVFLTGYYIRQSRSRISDNDSEETYGVDIEKTQSGGSSYCGDDDKYEDSFIEDDNESKIPAESPVQGSKDNMLLDNGSSEDFKVHDKQLTRMKKLSVDDDVDDDAYETADECAKFVAASDAIAMVLQDLKDTIIDSGNPERKRKEHQEKEKTSVDLVDKLVGDDSKRGSDISPIRKKRKKLLFDLTLANNIDPEGINVSNGDPGKFSEENRNMNDVCDEVEDSLEVDTTTKDVVPAKGGFQEQSDSESKAEACASQHGNNSKKEKKKTSPQKSRTTGTDCDMVQENQKITLPNGLTIEDLIVGPPNGKVVKPGRKIKVHYTCMLRDSGEIIDSKFEKKAFRFILGDDSDRCINGWNMGIEGMRVGGKRRLNIPPSLGYGDIGNGKRIPPNAWLVCDVEVLGVRRGMHVKPMSPPGLG